MSKAASSPTLEIQTGKHKGRRISIKAEEVIIGRGTTARIRIPSPEVSREHCKIIFKDRRLIVEDLNSHNGTFVNGRPITGKRYLPPGGTLTVGPMTFLLLGAPPKPPRPTSEVLLAGKVAVSSDYSDDEIVAWLANNSAESLSDIEAMETMTEIPVVPPSPTLPNSSKASANPKMSE